MKKRFRNKKKGDSSPAPKAKGSAADAGSKREKKQAAASPKQKQCLLPFILKGDKAKVAKALKRSDAAQVMHSELSEQHGNALHALVECKSEKVVSLVCESAVTLGVVMRCSLMEDANGLTPLALAASQGCDTLLEEFVDMVNRAIRNDQYGEKVEASKILNHQDCNGNTPLHHAVAASTAPCVRLLASCGVDLDFKNKEGVSPREAAEPTRSLIDALTCAEDRVATQLDQYLNTLCSAIQLKDEFEMSLPLRNVSPCLRVQLLNRVHEDSSRTPLQFALDVEDWGIVKQLLDAGADIHAQDQHGNTVLHDAAVNGMLERVQKLIELGPYLPTLPDNRGRLPAHLAAEWGAVDVVTYFGKTFPGITDTTDAKGHALFHRAAVGGRVRVMEALVELDGEKMKEQSKAKDLDGMTVLHLAVRNHKRKVVDWLLESSLEVDVNAEDNDGNTALHLAARVGTPLVIRCLVRHGAQCSKQNSSGATPLLLAVLRKDVGAMRSLLQTEVSEEVVLGPANIDFRDDAYVEHWDGESKRNIPMPLQRDLVTDEMLRAQYANADACGLEAVNCRGETAVVAAARVGFVGGVRLLAAAGGKLNAVDREGKGIGAYCEEHPQLQSVMDDVKKADPAAMLFEALKKHDTELIRNALTAGATPLAVNDLGQVALFRADNNADDIVALLSAAEGNDAVRREVAEARTSDGCTILHHLALRGVESWEVWQGALQLGIEKEIPVDVDSFRGATALHIAATLGHSSICRELILAGCSVDSTDGAGRTVMDVAKYGTDAALEDALDEFDERQAEEARRNVFTAIEDGDQELLKRALEDVQATHIEDDNGCSPLHCAALKGDASVCTMVLSKFPDINVTDEAGQSPVHVACDVGAVDVVLLFLREKCDISLRDVQGNTPLDIAVSRGFQEVVDILKVPPLTAPPHELKAKAEEEEADGAIVEEDRDATMWTAIASGDLSRLESALKAGAYLTDVDEYGAMPIHVASLNGFAEGVRMMIGHILEDEDEGALNCLLSEVDDMEQTPLHCAAASGHVEICRTLLEHGAPVDVEDSNGFSPLQWAETKGHVVVARLLRGEDVEEAVGEAGVEATAPDIVVEEERVVEDAELAKEEAPAVSSKAAEELCTEEQAVVTSAWTLWSQAELDIVRSCQEKLDLGSMMEDVADDFADELVTAMVGFVVDFVVALHELPQMWRQCSSVMEASATSIKRYEFDPATAERVVSHGAVCAIDVVENVVEPFVSTVVRDAVAIVRGDVSRVSSDVLRDGAGVAADCAESAKRLSLSVIHADAVATGAICSALKAASREGVRSSGPEAAVVTYHDSEMTVESTSARKAIVAAEIPKCQTDGSDVLVVPVLSASAIDPYGLFDGATERKCPAVVWCSAVAITKGSKWDGSTARSESPLEPSPPPQDTERNAGSSTALCDQELRPVTTHPSDGASKWQSGVVGPGHTLREAEDSEGPRGHQFHRSPRASMADNTADAASSEPTPAPKSTTDWRTGATPPSRGAERLVSRSMVTAASVDPFGLLAAPHSDRRAVPMTWGDSECDEQLHAELQGTTGERVEEWGKDIEEKEQAEEAGEQRTDVEPVEKGEGEPSGPGLRRETGENDAASVAAPGGKSKERSRGDIDPYGLYIVK